jgi:leader peptidase (prepilin peptidase)/N-methyltransferase
MELILIDLFIFLFCLFVGSFYNVVAIRLLKGDSFVTPPSHCPSCKQPLSAFDLIPVISYLFLRGRCRYCRASISVLYPLGELMGAFSLYAAYKMIGWSWELLPAFVLVSILVLAVLTDIREKLILDRITLPALALMLVLRLFIGDQPFWFYILGSAGAFLLLYLIALVSRGGMGGGDIKLYAFIGMSVGFPVTLMGFLFASFLGALTGGAFMLLKKLKRKDQIPFAPFIWLGTLIAYLFGEAIWEAYLGMW